MTSTRNVRGEGPRQQRPSHSSRHHGGRKERTCEQRFAQQPAACPIRARARNSIFGDMSTDVREAPITYACGTRRLATATGEAAIQVQMRLRRGRRSREQLLDEVDPSARAIEIIAEELIRWASRRAESAVRTRSKNGFGL